MSDHCGLQANANRDMPVVAIQCNAVSSPLQSGTPQPASTATNDGGDTNKANAAEALVLYAMQKVAAKATRYTTLQHNITEPVCSTYTAAY